MQDLIGVYAELARRSNYALHLGLTEAGMGSKGIVASSAAMGVLLQQGIGDTIRISLTPEPNGDRTLEVKVGQELLQTVGLRTFVPLVAACPGCGRTTSTTFQELASSIQNFIRDSMPEWKTRYPGVEGLNVAVMGCIVNGPGESKHADIGISLPGTGEQPTAPVFIDGKKAMTLRGPTVVGRLPEDRDRLHRAAIRRPPDRGGITHHRAGQSRSEYRSGEMVEFNPVRMAPSDQAVQRRRWAIKWLLNNHSSRESCAIHRPHPRQDGAARSSSVNHTATAVFGRAYGGGVFEMKRFILAALALIVVIGLQPQAAQCAADQRYQHQRNSVLELVGPWAGSAPDRCGDRHRYRHRRRPAIT